MKKELQAGTKEQQSTTADSSTSASVAANPMLSAALFVKEGNKLIAVFMGAKPYYLDVNVLSFPMMENPAQSASNTTTHHVSTLKYHSSFDWLMPVVEKIYKMEYDLFISIEWNEGEMGMFASFSNEEDIIGGIYKRTSDSLIDLVFFRVV